MTEEASFQKYFIPLVPHAYRTGIGNGFVDCLVVQGSITNYVELKVLKVGPSGNKAVRTAFKKTQPPWYAKYLAKGGNRLFVVFKLNKGYGIIHVDMSFVRLLPKLTYLEMKDWYTYREYKVLKELISDNFS